MTEKEIDILEEAVILIHKHENPLEGMSDEERINFFKENIGYLADPFLSLFNAKYNSEDNPVPADQIPDRDKDLFMLAGDAITEYQ